MNKGVFGLAAIMILMAACQNSNDDAVKDAEKSIEEAQQQIDETGRIFSEGGQPGQITVQGNIVSDQDGSSQLDRRIQVEQVGGLGSDGLTRVQVSQKKKAIYSRDADLGDFSKVRAMTSYVNLGCENLSAEETENLTEEVIPASSDSTLQLSAKKIFVCGSQLSQYSFLAITTEELILREATVKISSIVGSLSFATVKMSLQGENLIETEGAALAMSIFDAPSIDLKVSDEVQGEGTLMLRSIGGKTVSSSDQK